MRGCQSSPARERRSLLPVRLLERGADDVSTNPGCTSVRARLAALLRRANAAQSRQVFRAARCGLDVRAVCWVGDTEIEMPAREFDCFRVLVADPDRVFTRSELLQSVWGLGDWLEPGRWIARYLQREEPVV